MQYAQSVVLLLQLVIRAVCLLCDVLLCCDKVVGFRKSVVPSNFLYRATKIDASIIYHTFFLFFGGFLIIIVVYSSYSIVSPQNPIDSNYVDP